MFHVPIVLFCSCRFHLNEAVFHNTHVIKYVFDLRSLGSAVTGLLLSSKLMFRQRRLAKGTLRPFLRKMEAVNTHNKTLWLYGR